MAVTSNKPKPKVIEKTLKSDKPTFQFKKFTIILKTTQDLTARNVAAGVTEYLYDYDMDKEPEYVIVDEPVTEAEFDAAWDAA